MSYFRKFRISDACLVLLGVLFLALSARISFTPTVMGSPVPITGQSLAVLLMGCWLGPVRGAGIVILYLLIGVAGLPVFADGESGLEKMTGPGGGYLLGFLPSAILVGGLAEGHASSSFPKLMGIMVLGTFVILFCGWLRLGCTLGFREAFSFGIIPYLPGAIVKILAGTLLIRFGKMIISKAGSAPQKDTSPVQ